MSLTLVLHPLKPVVFIDLSSVHLRLPHVLEWADLTSNNPPTPTLKNLLLS
jgi:hypothetical protein